MEVISRNRSFTVGYLIWPAVPSSELLPISVPSQLLSTVVLLSLWLSLWVLSSILSPWWGTAASPCWDTEDGASLRVILSRQTSILPLIRSSERERSLRMGLPWVDRGASMWLSSGDSEISSHIFTIFYRLGRLGAAPLLQTSLVRDTLVNFKSSEI